jgi:lipopolysaccharide export LptBFGC system permease protein LptF
MKRLNQIMNQIGDWLVKNPFVGALITVVIILSFLLPLKRSGTLGEYIFWGFLGGLFYYVFGILISRNMLRKEKSKAKLKKEQ